MFSSLFRGEKRQDLEVRKKSSRHVGETVTISAETEQTASADHCRPVAGRLQPLLLQQSLQIHHYSVVVASAHAAFNPQ